MKRKSMFCRECGDILDDSSMVCSSHRKDGSRVPKGSCKSCRNRHERHIRTLLRSHPRPPPGTPCNCCGRIDKLHLDHDHSTGAFRGYLCKNCNLGIGLIGDSSAGVNLALAYLLRSESSDSINASSTTANSFGDGSEFSDEAEISREEEGIEPHEN